MENFFQQELSVLPAVVQNLIITDLQPKLAQLAINTFFQSEDEAVLILSGGKLGGGANPCGPFLRRVLQLIFWFFFLSYLCITAHMVFYLSYLKEETLPNLDIGSQRSVSATLNFHYKIIRFININAVFPAAKGLVNLVKAYTADPLYPIYSTIKNANVTEVAESFDQFIVSTIPGTENLVTTENIIKSLTTFAMFLLKQKVNRIINFYTTNYLPVIRTQQELNMQQQLVASGQPAPGKPAALIARDTALQGFYGAIAFLISDKLPELISTYGNVFLTILISILVYIIYKPIAATFKFVDVVFGALADTICESVVNIREKWKAEKKKAIAEQKAEEKKAAAIAKLEDKVALAEKKAEVKKALKNIDKETEKVAKAIVETTPLVTKTPEIIQTITQPQFYEDRQVPTVSKLSTAEIMQLAKSQLSAETLAMYGKK